MNDKLDEIELNFHELFSLFKQKWIIILFTTLLCGGAAFYYFYNLVPIRYTSEATIYLKPQSTMGVVDLTTSTWNKNSINTYMAFLKSERILEIVSTRLGGGISSKELGELIGVSNDYNTEIIRVKCTTPEANVSKKYAQTVVEVFADEMLSIIPVDNITIVDNASLPTSPDRVNILTKTAIGGLIGFALSFGTILLLYILDTHFKTVEQVENALDLFVLGTIPIEDKKKSKKDAYQYGNFPEVYRQIRTNIEFSSIAKETRYINVTSAVANEGKTTLSINLAVSCAMRHQKVLLMDADLRRSKIHHNLSIKNELGLTDLLKLVSTNQKVTTEEFYTFFQKYENKELDSLYVLTAGTKISNPLEILESSAFSNLMIVLKERFDMIIIDCPPILSVSDAIPVSNLSDGTVFMVSTKDSTKKQAKVALTALRRNGVRILGSVINKIDHKNSDYYYSYYKDYKEEK